MRFGEEWDTFKEKSAGGTGDYIRAMKEGDTSIHFLTETDGWVGYLEHYNPSGYSFPCTQDSDCPGCNSNIEKMKSKGRKVAFVCLTDDKWVNVYKIPKKFADRLSKRGERWGTMMDREYVITRTGTGLDTDYDVETGDKDRVTFDASAYEMPNIEKILQSAFDEAWPDIWDEPKPVKAAAKKTAKKTTTREALKQSTSKDGLAEFSEKAPY